MKVARVAEVRKLDQCAIEEFGIPEEILMENAGMAAYFVISEELGGVRDKRFTVFCGAGNNGGDGLVAARMIHSNGGDVKVLLMGKRDKMKGSARQNLDIISRMPLEIRELESAQSVRDITSRSDAIIDAIFGTGLIREVDGIYRDIIELINDSKKKVFSIDIPSGVNGDTGEVIGSAVKADCTVTYGLPKIGNMLYPGNDFCGKLYVSHISFPPALYNTDSLKIEINNPPELAQRNKDTHKGSYGRVLFIAGSSKYLGAPYFSALSFLKAGGGLAYLAAPESISPFIANRGSEIVFIPQKETSSGGIALDNKDKLAEFAQDSDMVVLGPGLSLDTETQELVRELAKRIKQPLLIDGDGLTAIAQDEEIIKNRGAETVLTPHPGEMSRITKKLIGEISKNRIDILLKASKELNAIIVLKGAHSLIGYPDETIFINTSGNPGMATAGSGDVLTGTIAAAYGLGLPLKDAVRTGVFLHGLSGDLAVRDKGEDGITAQDILDYLPTTLKYYRENFHDISHTLYGSICVV